MSEGAVLVELISDHELEQVVYNTFDLIITSLPGEFVDIHSPDRLSDHDIVSSSFPHYFPIKKPKRKVYKYQKKVQVGKDQEKAQSEKDPHSKNRGGKKPN